MTLRQFKIISAIVPFFGVILVRSLFAQSQELKDRICDDAKRYRKEITLMINSNPRVLDDLGGASAESLVMDCDAIVQYHVFKHEEEAIQSANRIKELIVPMNSYAAPLCFQGKCPILSIFSLEPQRGAVLVSVGRSGGAKFLSEAKKRMQQVSREKGKNFEFKMVATPDHIIDFVYGEGPHGEETLFLQSSEVESQIRGPLDSSAGIFFLEFTDLTNLLSQVNESAAQYNEALEDTGDLESVDPSNSSDSIPGSSVSKENQEEEKPIEQILKETSQPIKIPNGYTLDFHPVSQAPNVASANEQEAKEETARGFSLVEILGMILGGFTLVFGIWKFIAKSRQ